VSVCVSLCVLSVCLSSLYSVRVIVVCLSVSVCVCLCVLSVYVFSLYSVRVIVVLLSVSVCVCLCLSVCLSVSVCASCVSVQHRSDVCVCHRFVFLSVCMSSVCVRDLCPCVCVIVYVYQKIPEFVCVLILCVCLVCVSSI